MITTIGHDLSFRIFLHVCFISAFYKCFLYVYVYMCVYIFFCINVVRYYFYVSSITWVECLHTYNNLVAVDNMLAHQIWSARKS